MMKHLLHFILYVTLFVNSAVFAAGPVKIILDTDMLTDPEDVNALCLLHALADKGEAEILAVVCNGHESNRASGAAVDTVNTFHGRPDIPIGTYKGDYQQRKSTFTFLLRDKFPHKAPSDDELPDALEIYRRILASQPDHSVAVVSIGHLVNIKDLLDSKPDQYSDLNGKELIRKKMKLLSVMGGKYPQGKEHNFFAGGVGPATKYVTENFPDEIPVVFSGYEIGEKIISGKKYKEQLPACPLRTALENAYNAINQGRFSWDETSVIYAVRGSTYQGKEYWKLQSKGSVLVNEDGSNEWVETPDKNQSYLIESAPPDTLAELMEKMILESINNALKK
jgi:inosine-uridine nucleoside N-ribohydrolase